MACFDKTFSSTIIFGWTSYASWACDAKIISIIAWDAKQTNHHSHDMLQRTHHHRNDMIRKITMDMICEKKQINMGMLWQQTKHVCHVLLDNLSVMRMTWYTSKAAWAWRDKATKHQGHWMILNKKHNAGVMCSQTKRQIHDMMKELSIMGMIRHTQLEQHGRALINQCEQHGIWIAKHWQHHGQWYCEED